MGGARSPLWAPALTDRLSRLAASTGLRQVHAVAWRDLDDPEAGGSERHAHEIFRRWAAAGIDVTVRTSKAGGLSEHSFRCGYRLVRKHGRYLVFPLSAASGLIGRDGTRDAVVEIWNGVPFFSPLWARAPRIVFLHHVHAEMWRMVLRPRPLARVGELLEFRLAPPLYRRVPIVTLSQSSKAEIVDILGLPERNITVVPPGIDPMFSPGGRPSPHPLVVAVGRLVPVKRFHLLIDVLAELKRRHRGLEAVVVGEGSERKALEGRRRERGAERWLHLPGYVNAGELVELYRRAWVIASTSAREGWGMTITEAAASGTPAVATAIGGHRDAVVHGQTGFLADDLDQLGRHLDRVLSHEGLRRRLAANGLQRAARLSWDAAAYGALEVLTEEVTRRSQGSGRRPL